MSTYQRERIHQLSNDLREVLAWGEAAEQANAGLVAERDAAVALADSRYAEMGHLLEEISGLRATINGLGNKLAEKDYAIAALDARCLDIASAMTAAIAEKDATIAAKDGEITEWEQSSLADAQQILQLTTDLGAAHDEIERLKAELSIFKAGGASPETG